MIELSPTATAAAPSTFSRFFNRDGERASAECQVSPAARFHPEYTFAFANSSVPGGFGGPHNGLMTPPLHPY